jgi:hypothetical protein
MKEAKKQGTALHDPVTPKENKKDKQKDSNPDGQPPS